MISVQGVVTPIGTVGTAKTGVKKWLTGQGVFLSLVKQSRTIFVTGYCSQTVKSLFADVYFSTVKQSRALLQCGQAIKSLVAVRSNSQAAKMTVKIS